MYAPLDGSVRFGAFQLDLRTGELRKSGTRINLPEQPLQVLKALLDRPGDLVTRDELRQRLWPAETFVDFEHGLNAAVRRLRDALGDSAEMPRFVETLPRRGYRFIAPVAPGVEPPPPRPGIGDPGGAIPTLDPTRARRGLTRAWGAALLASIIGVSAAFLWATGYLPWPRASSQAHRPDRMLVVLPFQNLTGDPDQEYLGDAMTEELIAQLGRIDPSRLGVIARTSAMQFKNTTKRADQIGSELGAGYLVEGSIRTTGTRIRIAVKLIETRSERQLWTEQYERDANDLLTVQREVGEAITEQITTSLSIAGSNVNAARRHSTNPEAYEHYLRGRYHWGRNNAESLEKGKGHFLKAIELDSSYALAYSGLADTYKSMGAIGFRPMSEAYPLARTAALKALELDDKLGEAHTSLAAIMADYYWDWAEAGRHFERAIELNPNYELSLRSYSYYLSCMARPEEARVLAEAARRLNPVSARAQMNLAIVLYLARRYDEAITAVAETLELAPDSGPAHIMLGRIYAAKGSADRAVEALERAHEILGPRPDVITPHAYVLAKAGRRQEALAKLDELREFSKPRDPAPIRIAIVHIALGDTDRAFEWLHKAVEARDWQMAMLKVEPAFDSLRSDPRFTALLERVGLPR